MTNARRAARTCVLFATIVASLTVPRGQLGTAAAASLSARPLTSYSASLSWTAPGGTTWIQVLRNSRLIDQFAASAGSSYTDYLLWPRTSYTYAVRFVSSNWAITGALSSSITTPSQVGSFPRLYAASSFWNTPVGSSPALDASSPSIVKRSLVAYASLGTINNDDQWGIPLAYAQPASRNYTVGCLMFGCDSTVTFRVPRYAKVNTGSDGHLAVVDPGSNTELDLWKGQYDTASDAWSAGTRTAAPATWGGSCPTLARCTGGGVAAGFLEFGGVIRPEEIAQGHIDHALVISGPYIRRNFIACPATNIWASQSTAYADDPNAIPLGARVQLDPAFDVKAQHWPRWEKIVARALQVYGAYVGDVSGTLELRGEANITRGYDAWAKVGMTTTPHPSLANLPWGRFRVLSIQAC